MKPKVIREGNKVWIEGVEPHRWIERCNSIVNCLTGAVRAVGEDLTYEYLMGASGAAFRVQVNPGGPCPCAPHANLGYRCTDRAAWAAGYNLEWININKDDPDSVKKARDTTIKSVDRGCPVLWSSEECGLLIGYVNGGEKMLCRGYWDEKITEHTDWPWEIGILTKKETTPTRREVLLSSLETAVEMSDFGRCKAAKVDFLVGFPAYRKWIQFLLDDDHWQTVNEGKPKPDHGNAWCYENLAGSRAAAAKYLRAIVAVRSSAIDRTSLGAEGDESPDYKLLLTDEAASHLTKAAELYQRMDKEVLNKQCILTVAPYPWTMKEGEYWTRQQRHAEAALLKQAMALEKKAVREIEQALALVKASDL
ncbi:MAG: hypothetical protein HY318_10020 [Armatimonadetes bacterium]|nr:hypothetical protein [Armatimonadota bacterium]